MQKPEQVPQAVKDGVARYARQHDISPDMIDLQFDCIMGCYYFMRCGMFHGVELDGYVHT